MARIKRNPTLGYEVEVSWQANLSEKKETQKTRQAVIAFADDTTWIANTKEQLKRTIKIAGDFFKVNDIQINSAKSKLIVLNARDKVEERKILVENQEIFSMKEKKAIRFLGIWIGYKFDKKLTMAKAKQISRFFANMIR